jgi:hypothetical protein
MHLYASSGNYTKDTEGQLINARDTPKKKLQEKATIIMIMARGCISEWEEVIDHEEFLKVL